jgi:hypothetical protein
VGIPARTACAEQQVALCDRLAEIKDCTMSCAGYAAACMDGHDSFPEDAQIECLAAIATMDECSPFVPAECTAICDE